VLCWGCYCAFSIPYGEGCLFSSACTGVLAVWLLLHRVACCHCCSELWVDVVVSRQVTDS
jgi:hypothetical protein